MHVMMRDAPVTHAIVAISSKSSDPDLSHLDLAMTPEYAAVKPRLDSAITFNT